MDESDDYEGHTLRGEARIVYMPVGHVGERLAIAIVGQVANSKPFARAVTPRLLKCLPNDLGQALLNFGTVVASDFTDFISSGRRLSDWQPPLVGLEQSESIMVEGADFAYVTDAAVRLCALWEGSPQEVEPEASVAPPRASEEARFFEEVRNEVIQRRPSLKAGFKRSFNLAGGQVVNEVDFVGSRYATCYAAINPKARSAGRTTNASAALWRLARAREFFGFAAPATIELTAWVPPEGLPIYSDSEYETVRQTVAELKAQASKEQLDVCATRDWHEAARRLIEIEGDKSN